MFALSPLSVKNYLLTLVVLLCLPFSGNAADTASFRYPRIILVQLNTEQSRLKAMERAGKKTDVAEIEHDAAMVREKMIADFTANLRYCPVYFFLDTNADLVRAKMFSGILLNAAGNIVKDPPVTDKTSDYAVAYFGHYIAQSKSVRVITDSSKYIYDPEAPTGKGLVLLNDKFQQISYIGYLGFAQPSNDFGNYYSSDKYDINYFPLAKKLEQRLDSKRRRKPKNRYRIKPGN